MTRRNPRLQVSLWLLQKLQLLKVMILITFNVAISDYFNFKGNSDGEKVVALFAYSGQYEDELSFEVFLYFVKKMFCLQFVKLFLFKAGEEITIVAKDEEAWWRGEVNGRNGVFPSNYVEPAQQCK